MTIYDTREGTRLVLNQQKRGHWNRWGPFLSERAWGIVREDYSPNGEAWGYFPHDHARARAYRWNEDGISGICDSHTVEIAGASHAVYVSHPKEVADVIESAARAVSK